MQDPAENYMDEESRGLYDRYREEKQREESGFYDVDEYLSIIASYGIYENHKGARDVLREARERYPESSELRIKEAELLMEDGQAQRALELLAEAEKVESYFYELHLIRGHSLKALGEYDKAAQSFLKARDTGAEEVDVEIGLAAVASAEGKREEAWRHMRKILGSQADNAELCNRFIDLAVDSDCLVEAMEYVRELLKEHPYKIHYWKTLSELAEEAGNYEQALEAEDFVLAIDPDNEESLLRKMHLIEFIDEDIGHLDFYLSLEKRWKDDVEKLLPVRLDIAHEYELAENRAQAEVYYNKVLSYPQARRYALFRLGVLAHFRFDLPLAMRYFSQALEGEAIEEEKESIALIYRGIAQNHIYKGEEEPSFAFLRKAIEEAPLTRVHAYAYVEEVCRVGGEAVNEALAFFKEGSPSEAPWFALCRAVLFYEKGRYEDAYRNFSLAFAEGQYLREDADTRFSGLYFFDSAVLEIRNGFAPAFSPEAARVEDEEPFEFYGPALQDGYVRFGLVGHSLDHSFSASYFNQKFMREGLALCLYQNLDMENGQGFEIMKNTEVYRGFNVTIPYKRAVLPYLDELSPAARAIGGVNVVDVRAGRWVGHNTDYKGFAQSLEGLLAEGGAAPERALVLGNGGASQAVQYALHQKGIPYVLVCREPEKAREDLKNKEFSPLEILSYATLTPETARSCRLWVNTTSLGMWPEVDTFPPVPYEVLSGDCFAFDVVYNPEQTAFLQKCAAQGAKTRNGLQMLHIQAEEAWKIWTA